MLIRSEFAIEFQLPVDAAMIGLLRLHPSLDERVREPETLTAEHLEAPVLRFRGVPISTAFFAVGEKGENLLTNR